MMPKIEIADTTDARLKHFAIPLEDTYDSVISRLLDMAEGKQTSLPPEPSAVAEDPATLRFSAKSLPQLRFTTLTRIELNGERLPKGETFWNKLMNRLIVEAVKNGHGKDAVFKMLFVNAVPNKKTDNGYNFIPEVGLSVQNQDANGAARQAFELADQLGFSLKVYFYWQDNPKAAHPNRRAVVEL